MSMKWLAALAAWLFGWQAQAADMPLRWDNPTNNTDGTVLTDLAGVRVVYGTASSNYTHTATFTNMIPGAEGRGTLTGLVAKTTYYISSKAFNTDGIESALSQQFVEQAKTRPGPPRNLGKVGQ